MSHIGSRRHRLNVDEAPHVYALVHGRLQQLLIGHNKEPCGNISIGSKEPLTSPSIDGEVPEAYRHRAGGPPEQGFRSDLTSSSNEQEVVGTEGRISVESLSSAEETHVDSVDTDEVLADDEGTLYGEALSLFRLLWRMDHNYPGRPEYPEPVTWTLLESYLTSSQIWEEVNVPLMEAGA